jgi:SET domain-containing protein
MTVICTFIKRNNCSVKKVKVSCTFLFLCCFSIDATASESDTQFNERLGRFVNDAPKKHANCIAKPVFLAGKPRILLFAVTDIKKGTELRYDYGGKHLPWRKVSSYINFGNA